MKALQVRVLYEGMQFTSSLSPFHSDQGKFKRIPVFRDPRGGYGYAPPYEFDSLLSLVLYYAVHTMEKHSPDLKATLQHPAFAPHHR